MMVETLLYIYMSHLWNRVHVTPPVSFMPLNAAANGQRINERDFSWRCITSKLEASNLLCTYFQETSPDLMNMANPYRNKERCDPCAPLVSDLASSSKDLSCHAGTRTHPLLCALHGQERRH